MKKIVFVFILLGLLTGQGMMGQTANFFVDGSVWTYFTNESCEPSAGTVNQNYLEKDSIYGDTVINSITYKRLFVKRQMTLIPLNSNCNQFTNSTIYPYVNSEQFLRYDTLSKKVYMVNDTGTFVPEVLIYNFNLVAGDTVPLHSSICPSCFTIIDSVKNIVFFGIPTRKFYLPGVSTLNYIIQGMGGSNGLTFFTPVYNVVSGGIYSTILDCFHSGDSIYNPSGYNCPSFINVGIAVLNDQETISISPNPASTSITLTTHNPQPTTIAIYNMLGEVVISHLAVVNSQSTINISQLSNGIYFVEVQTEKGVFRKKFVKE